jgi:hypothetical protein
VLLLVGDFDSLAHENLWRMKKANKKTAQAGALERRRLHRNGDAGLHSHFVSVHVLYSISATLSR